MISVRCPKCNLEYRIDKSRIINDIKFAKCKACGNRFPLEASLTLQSMTGESSLDIQDIKESETKKCPFCAETIRSEAKKCRFCHERLDTVANLLEEAPAKSSDDDFENRILCSDGNCIGTIGKDGKCRICGNCHHDNSVTPMPLKSESLESAMPRINQNKPSTKSFFQVVIVFAVISTLLVTLGPVLTNTSNREKAITSETAKIRVTDEINIFDVWSNMQELVKQRLKAPSTAKFPDCFDTTASVIGKPGGGRFHIVSYVDAQNSFGASLRTYFICMVKQEGKNWILESYMEITPSLYLETLNTANRIQK